MCIRSPIVQLCRHNKGGDKVLSHLSILNMATAQCEAFYDFHIKTERAVL